MAQVATETGRVHTELETCAVVTALILVWYVARETRFGSSKSSVSSSKERIGMVLSQFPGSHPREAKSTSLPTSGSSLLSALSVLPEVSLELDFAQFFTEATNSQETICIAQSIRAHAPRESQRSTPSPSLHGLAAQWSGPYLE